MTDQNTPQPPNEVGENMIALGEKVLVTTEFRGVFFGTLAARSAPQASRRLFFAHGPAGQPGTAPVGPHQITGPFGYEFELRIGDKPV
jgi:hypothetical protein